VGQSEYSFSPCLTSSSSRMSKVENFVPVAFIASTTRRLNPQRGASGLPFMNNRTSLPPSKALMRVVMSCFAGMGAFGSAALLFVTAPPASLPTFSTSNGTSAPSSVSTCFLSLMSTKNGTEATLYCSDTSYTSSASTRKNLIPVFSFASSTSTVSMCLHGSLHDAQK